MSMIQSMSQRPPMIQCISQDQLPCKMQDMEPGPYKAGCDGYMSDFMVYKVAMSGREEHSFQVWHVPLEMLF